MVRRGGPTDPSGPDGQPQNRLFYDLNTHGGKDGFWQIGRGPTHINDSYPVLTSKNYGARYPQGLLWAPPGSTDTSQSVFLSLAPVLDSSNGDSGVAAFGLPNGAAKATSNFIYE
jgi:hypothetical protein